MWLLWRWRFEPHKTSDNNSSQKLIYQRNSTFNCLSRFRYFFLEFFILQLYLLTIFFCYFARFRFWFLFFLSHTFFLIFVLHIKRYLFWLSGLILNDFTDSLIFIVVRFSKKFDTLEGVRVAMVILELCHHLQGKRESNYHRLRKMKIFEGVCFLNTFIFFRNVGLSFCPCCRKLIVDREIFLARERPELSDADLNETLLMN